MKTTEELREEFDDKFTTMGMGDKWRPGFDYTPNEIFNFFLKDREDLLREVREEVESMVHTYKPCVEEHCETNETVDNVLNLLDSLSTKNT